MFYDEVMNAARYIRERVACRPRIAVILGSGLGGIADRLEKPESFYDRPALVEYLHNLK